VPGTAVLTRAEVDVKSHSPSLMVPEWPRGREIRIAMAGTGGGGAFL
jgi:hypothetical protein